MAQDTQVVAITQLGQEKSDFPFLRLPPEIRNRIYQEILHEDFVVMPHVSPQPGLLRTNKQIRNEALPIYYGANQFFVSIQAPDDVIRIPSALQFFVNNVPTSIQASDDAIRIPSALQFFVDNVPTRIKAHVRHVIIHIHNSFNPRTSHYDHIIEFTDGSHRPILASRRVGEPSVDWTNYSSARNVFYTTLVDMPFEILLEGHDVYTMRNQSAYGLFQAAWLLARTFTAATKSVYTDSWKLKDLGLVYELLRLNREGLDV